MFTGGYLREVLEYHTAFLERTLRALEGRDFDVIACRGLSGAVIGPIVANKLGKHLLMIRKGESNHACNSCEGYCAPSAKAMIVDDVVCSGGTMRAMISEIIRQGLIPVGYYLYQETWSSQHKFEPHVPRIIGPLDDLCSEVSSYLSTLARNEQVRAAQLKADEALRARYKGIWNNPEPAITATQTGILEAFAKQYQGVGVMRRKVLESMEFRPTKIGKRLMVQDEIQFDMVFTRDETQFDKLIDEAHRAAAAATCEE